MTRKAVSSGSGRRWICALALSLVGALPPRAHAGGNVCFRDGAPIDDRTTQKPFTGVYTCKDMDNGKLTLREHQVAGVKEGAYEHFSSFDGTLDESGSYLHGKLHGSMKRFHKDGLPYLEFNYVEGKLLGAQKDFHDGHLSRLYWVKEDGQVGNELSFNDAGQPMQFSCRDHVIEERDRAWCGQNGKQSTVTLYSQDGKKSAVVQYLDGKQHGLEQRFYVKTGKLMSQTQYEHGKRIKDGEQSYDSEGRLRFKIECQAKAKTLCTETQMFDKTDLVERTLVTDGDKLTKQTDYFQNGKPKRELTLEGDHYQIVARNDRGLIQTRGAYLPEGRYRRDDYTPDGLVEQLYEDGSLASKETYKRGVLDGSSVRNSLVEGHAVRREYDYSDGTLTREKLLVDGKPISEWTYFPDGSVKTTQSFGPSPIKI